MLRRLVRAPAASLGSCCGATRVAVRFGSHRDKVVSVEDAVYLVPDGCTVTVGGFVAQGSPEYVLEALGQRFAATGSPKGLTLVFGGGPGDSNNKGINHFAKPGMLKRCIGGHYGQAPMLAKMAEEGAFEAYLCPMGSISRMIRAGASGVPGHITKVGSGTLVDPANGGGKLNAITKDDIVTPIEIDGQRYLMYRALPIDVAIIRGTTADPDGNITCERESLLNDNLVQAMAGRSRRGFVIAQVERLSAKSSLSPRSVRIPGTMVDCVVVAPEDKHPMSYWSGYDPSVSGEQRAPPKKSGEITMKLDERKIIARRAALELVPDQVVNLGIGMPEGVAAVAEEEDVLKFLSLTTEPGVHGGAGLSGYNFGPAKNPDAFIEMHEQFDFYNGGGLDITFLGNAETDATGNVNVTRAGPKLTGPGGFIDISQSTKCVNLLGAFTAGGLEVDIKDGKVTIKKEGKIRKFTKKVKEITFSGAQAIANRQHVKYITERCVFQLLPEGGLELSEIAPGIDLKKDILGQMDFTPAIREPLPLMDASIFAPAAMGLLGRNFSLNFAQRIHRATPDLVYINLKGATVYDRETLDELREGILKVAREAGKKLDAIVTYDGFDVAPSLIDDYAKLTRELDEKCWRSVRRVSSTAFTRHKLAASMQHFEQADGRKPVDAATAYDLLRKFGLHISESHFAELFRKYSGNEPTMPYSELKTLIDDAMFSSR